MRQLIALVVSIAFSLGIGLAVPQTYAQAPAAKEEKKGEMKKGEMKKEEMKKDDKKAAKKAAAKKDEKKMDKMEKKDDKK